MCEGFIKSEPLDLNAEEYNTRETASDNAPTNVRTTKGALGANPLPISPDRVYVSSDICFAMQNTAD